MRQKRVLDRMRSEEAEEDGMDLLAEVAHDVAEDEDE